VLFGKSWIVHLDLIPCSRVYLQPHTHTPSFMGRHLGWSYHLHFSHRVLSTWGAVMLKKKKHNKTFVHNIYIHVHLFYNAWFLLYRLLHWHGDQQRFPFSFSHTSLHVWKKMTVPWLYLYHRRLLSDSKHTGSHEHCSYLIFLHSILSSFLPQVLLQVPLDLRNQVVIYKHCVVD